jgi:hypothetical protein
MPFNTQPPYNVTKVDDVTASRAIDGTVYQNLTGKTMFVTICGACSGNVGATAVFGAYIGANAAPNENAGAVGISSFTAGLVLYLELEFKVPPGWYYRGSSAGNCIMFLWVEAY